MENIQLFVICKRLKLELILKKQNNPWKKLVQTDLSYKVVHMIDFLKNRDIRNIFSCILKGQAMIFIPISVIK